MAGEEEEEIETEYKGPEKEEPEYEDEIPDTKKGEDEAGADVDKLTNLIWNYRSTIEKLDHLLNTLKSSITEKEKAAVEGQIGDALNGVLEARRRIDDYRVEMGDAAPPPDELEASLNEQAEIALADAQKNIKGRE